MLGLLSIYSTVFASTRGDLNAAFSFLYEKSVRSSMQAEQMSKIYISILNSENSCIKKTSQFCEDSSVSPQIEKMIIPQIGLSDGIVHLLYEKYKAKNAIHVNA